jgi:hypothetical protein
MRLGRDVELAPLQAGAGAHAAGVQVDVDPPQRAQVDHEAVVDDGEAGERVTAGADGERHVAVEGEAQRGDHVVGRTRPRDERRVAVDGAVEDAAGGVVLRVSRRDDLAGEGLDGGVGEEAHGRSVGLSAHRRNPNVQN